MKNLFILLIALIVSIGVSTAQEIPPRPNPPKLVNDLAKKFTPTEIAQLEQKLVAYFDSTSTQIALVTIPSTEPYPIADYAFKLGRDWGVGEKDKNNGIVILWASGDRKIYIATGYGMEGAIPDAIAKRIISTVIIPKFKNEQYYQGIDKGIDAIISYSKGEYQAEPDQQNEGLPGKTIFIIIAIIIALIILTRNKRGGGGGGYRDSSGPLFWPTSTFSGWGHSSGNWGGSSGGGGFGGFGGGSFGGGGAGGDY
jgi:uncharacterized protein